MMENDNTLDLSGSKWIPENEIYIMSIMESFSENFPEADIDSELKHFNFTTEDLLEEKKLKKLLEHLRNKFPDEESI